ncbi:MAG TPA: hypothetical protein VGL56_00865 [Fimbriimonadaceae bacterium]|jgi:hypothetical protein
MSNSIEEYLAELRKRLSKRLSQSEVEDHLAETRQHLECASAENGEGPEGEKKATQAFGDPQKLSTQIIDAHSPRRPWSAAGAIACLVGVPLSLLLVAFLFQKSYGMWTVSASFIILTVLFVCFSVRNGSPLSKQIAVAGLAVGFLFPMLECFMFVTTMPEVGHGLVPRFEAKSYIAAFNKESAQLASIKKLVSNARQAYGADSKVFRSKVQTATGYVVPVRLITTYLRGYGANYSVETRTLATFDDAKIFWEESARWGAFSTVDDRAGDASTIEDELQKPILSEYRVFLSDYQSWQALAVYILLMVVLNYLCVSIPIWFRRAMRRRPIST